MLSLLGNPGLAGWIRLMADRFHVWRDSLVDRKLLISMLLAPVAPLLGWGPITHIYFNKRALDRLSASNIKDKGLKEILGDEKLRRVFINASNSVDLIKANNLRNRERYFEYAHNTIPNFFWGDPVMGRYLVEEVRKSDDDPVNRAWAYGWLAHQVVDVFAHKIPHAGCEGWVNSRRVLAGFYSKVREDEPARSFQNRIKLYIADHWLTEMLTDCLCYSREREFMDGFTIDLSVPTKGEITAASTRILTEYENELGPGYLYFEPLTDKKIKAIVDYYHLLILCSTDIYRAILRAYPGDAFEEYIQASPRMSRLGELLENSIEAVRDIFLNPDNPWQPGKWLSTEEEESIDHSVYEYERDWRPGNYDFGRKSGFVGALYYNRGSDFLIRKARDIALRINLWLMIDLGIRALNNRGFGQWQIAGSFIKTLIDLRPANVSDTMEKVGDMRNLERYPEIVPD